MARSLNGLNAEWPDCQVARSLSDKHRKWVSLVLHYITLSRYMGPFANYIGALLMTAMTIDQSEFRPVTIDPSEGRHVGL